MIDLDERIARILQEHADGPVDTDRLVSVAVNGGRARRRRRRTLGTGLGLVALFGLLLTVIGAPRDVRTPDATATAGVLVPPPARGAAAGQRPELVGTDPATLHFGIDRSRARYLGWEVSPGLEGARLDVGGGRAVTVELARSSAVLRQYGITGLPGGVTTLAAESAFTGATLRAPAERGSTPVWVRHWRPGPGLYARATVTAETGAELDVAARALRLDETRHCAAPVRLTTLPPGARLAGCTVDAPAFPEALTVRLAVAGSGDRRMEISFQYARSIAEVRTQGNRMVGDRAAQLDRRDGAAQLELFGFPKAHLVAAFGWPYQGFTEADAATVLGGARVADDLTRPERWN
ncbi:hypothetical protein E1211_26125 [Micromonospora sp. 15K316]|uniref:hypothetical protein n=1 Tax=Micromonospora sp. 15K316 TaxID=2530376 RepID=UPI0010510BC9|nr:hypothetical protein [Micromonospora sp. 15K316]TDC29365.1 hypothetical protein E1211_26125 [Micromonospora sp. 15K316]